MVELADTREQFLSVAMRYRAQFEPVLEKAIRDLGEDSKLHEACRYALFNGGKRFRPILVLMVAEALKRGLPVGEAATAVECFHTASLIADDLPCMDDDDERRDHPALHKEFDEAIAILSSFALISAGYTFINDNAKTLRKLGLPVERICTKALDVVNRTTGLEGASGGQYLDLYETDYTVENLRKVVKRKTSTLFEISFALGWLFGGGEEECVDLVCKTADHYGVAFQIADDFKDVLQDDANGRGFNFVGLLGTEAAAEEFFKEIKGYREGLSELGIATEDLLLLADVLSETVERLR